MALRCITLAQSPLIPEVAKLVSDDQVLIDRIGETIRARAPVTIAGKMEIRGIGIMAVPAICDPVTVTLVVNLDTNGEIERLPDPWPQAILLGIPLPLLTLNPFEASAPLKLMLALSSPTLPPAA